MADSVRLLTPLGHLPHHESAAVNPAAGPGSPTCTRRESAHRRDRRFFHACRSAAGISRVSRLWRATRGTARCAGPRAGLPARVVRHLLAAVAGSFSHEDHTMTAASATSASTAPRRTIAFVTGYQLSADASVRDMLEDAGCLLEAAAGLTEDAAMSNDRPIGPAGMFGIHHLIRLAHNLVDAAESALLKERSL